MSIESEINRIKGNISSAFTACENKGATLPASQISDNLASTINAIPAGATVNIENLCQSVTNIFGNANYIINSDYTLAKIIKGNSVLAIDATTLTSTTFSYAYQNNTNIIGASLGNITTVGEQITEGAGCVAMFNGATNFEFIDVSNVQNIYSQNSNGDGGFAYAFNNTKIKELKFTSFVKCNNKALFYSMIKPLNGVNIYFNALTSNISSKTKIFYFMCNKAINTVVHFPSNLQSVIGSWTDVTSGFGGTNTTVLFDLPATT